MTTGLVETSYYAPPLPVTVPDSLVRLSGLGADVTVSTVNSDVDLGPVGNGREVILQGFNWECNSQRNPSWYKVVEAKAPAIAEAGITAVWLPPPSNSVSYEGYLPREYECLTSSYGTEQELRSCLAALKGQGIKVIADIVLNHRCAHYQGPEGAWNSYGGRYNWDASCICSNNKEYRGVGECKKEEVFEPAPNVDHSNSRVRQDIKHFLNFLRKDVGFDGWRFDFVKGYNGRYVEDYIAASRPTVAVGEFWDSCNYTNGVLDHDQDSHRQRIIDWCDSTTGTSAAFDFTTKGILQEAIQRKEYWRLRDKEGKPPGVVGWWPSRAVTFIENHDTGSTQNHWPFPARGLWQGYAYILTHPGTPCIFYDHLWTDGTKASKVKNCLNTRFQCLSGNSSKLISLGVTIVHLVSIRERNGISCRSQVCIREANADVYAATIDDKIAMKIGPGAWCPQAAGIFVAGKSWRLGISGVNFAVWETVAEGQRQ